MKSKSVLVATIIVCVAHVSARAQSADALLNLLQRKGLITSQEVQEVKTQLDADLAKAVEKYDKTKLPKWVEKMTFSGDLRLRAENRHYEDSLGQPDRVLYRFRLRLGVESQFTDWAMVGVRLATGDGDPLATNQSFTDSFRKKPFNIDLAYVALQPPGFDSFKVIGGKMPIPMWQPAFASPMVYDPDVTPEGIAEQLNYRFGDKKQFRAFANFGQFALKELSTDANDVYLFDFEGGLEAKLNNRLRVTAAGGYYLTHNLANSGYKVGDAPNTAGNAVFVSGSTTNYLADFNVLYARAEIAWTINDKPFLGTPALLTLGGEYDENLTGAYDTLSGAVAGTTNPGQTTGWTVQLAFGDLKKKGQWQVVYQYKRIEADSVWDGITDSDFGNGGTDRKGHAIRGAYNLTDWWQIGVNASLTSKISSRPNANKHNQQGDPADDMLRLQADSTFKF